MGASMVEDVKNASLPASFLEIFPLSTDILREVLTLADFAKFTSSVRLTTPIGSDAVSTTSAHGNGEFMPRASTGCINRSIRKRPEIATLIADENFILPQTGKDMRYCTRCVNIVYSPVTVNTKKR
jgi:hypothetical protein